MLRLVGAELGALMVLQATTVRLLNRGMLLSIASVVRRRRIVPGLAHLVPSSLIVHWLLLVAHVIPAVALRHHGTSGLGVPCRRLRVARHLRPSRRHLVVATSVAMHLVSLVVAIHLLSRLGSWATVRAMTRKCAMMLGSSRPILMMTVLMLLLLLIVVWIHVLYYCWFPPNFWFV